MPQPNETRFLAYVLAQLSTEPGCAVIQPSGLVVGDPHPRAVFWRQNTGAARAAGRLIRFGVPGQADIAGVVVGRRVDIETKTVTGRQSREQREYEALITGAGAVYILARALDDVLVPVRRMLSC